WLIEKVKEVKIESIHLVPSLLSLLLQDGLEQCISLKKVFTIGERLPVAVQREFFRKLPQAQLFVFYGCTEAPGATFREILPNEGFGDRVILGKPQNNKKIYLLDKYKVPVPIGVPGEIFVGGRISRGYVKNNTLTRERFIPDPFTGKPGDRMYQTGDMGRFLEDGNIEYLGRTDFQVKIRGIRIEPAEVDIRVTEHPSILECVTVAKEDASGDNRLISYYVRNKQAQPLKENELSEFIRKRLPEYMVPAAFVAIDKIPLLFNGKIDRKSLPDLEIVGSRISEAAQGSVLEKQLTDIWEEILDAKQVSRRDNYFELGGNSLKVLRLCQRIKSDLDKTVSVAEVYENPTIKNLAKLLQDEKRGERFSHFFGGASGQTPI
ncbi:MAG: AMP-binding protein, partial [Verrucomicrobiae bacterium]|nr:AMP-binding protein [Verrucomicrobiae bacterium]